MNRTTAALSGALSMTRHHAPLSLLLAALLALSAPPAKAADTLETWDLGASAMEMYAGYDGLGLDSAERAATTTMLLDLGVLPGFSAYLGLTVQGDGVLENGQGSIFLGLLGTPLDTDHVDLDLTLDVSAGGPGLSEFHVAPGLELNLDLTPDRTTAGFYLRVGMPVYGRRTLASPAADHGAAFSIEVKPGIYWTIAEGHQLLIEADMAFHRKSADDHKIDIGGLALGYNVEVHERIELINQVYVDIPQSGEDVAVGLMVGFIALLPTGAPQP